MNEYKILGYADKFSLRPGETISVKVSCVDIKTYNTKLIKIIQGDINPQGPGYKEEILSNDLGGPFKARHQAIPIGSYGIVQHKKIFSTLTKLSISVYIFPTLLKNNKKQVIFSKKDKSRNLGLELYINHKDQIQFSINDLNIIISEKLKEKNWYYITANYDPTNGAISISSKLLNLLKPDNKLELKSKIIKKDLNFNQNKSNLIIGANLNDNISSNFFNGKIDSLQIFNRVVDLNIQKIFKNYFAKWNFSKNISTDKIFDDSKNKLHGKLINHPARGVTGYKWKEKFQNWNIDSSHHSSIHFHQDDLTDCKWKTDFKFKIPYNFKSGIYGFKLYNKKNEFYIPFCVKPKRQIKKNKILYIMPTASYLAYANNRIGIDVPETESVCGRLIEINDQDIYLQEHPELGLSFYDLHDDGSPVFYSSKKRPIINYQPKSIGKLGGIGSNVWQFNADTHITGWLDKYEYEFDVVTDEDLHNEGYELIKDYKVLLTGTHPEYYSLKMINSIQKYQFNGGRLMYLGGNGFYWRISYDLKSSNIIECRKSENGIRATDTNPGENYSSLTGEYTGLWERNGIPPNDITGIGMVSQGFDVSSPYHRTKASYKKEFRFIFKGVKENIIGNFGLSGGAAAGLEIDATSPDDKNLKDIHILASSKKHSDIYLMTPEDLLDPTPGISGTETNHIRSEMILYKTINNGAVFSVGSIAWAGSMVFNNYKNDISKITKNVLDEFLKNKVFN